MYIYIGGGVAKKFHMVSHDKIQFSRIDSFVQGELYQGNYPDDGLPCLPISKAENEVWASMGNKVG